jgi:polysaccharide pyruvyl transferase WcaK-like protein
MKHTALRVGVLGHYGNDNLGDEAIVQAVIENVRTRAPCAEVVCFSVNPVNTTWRHGVPAYPITRHAAATAPRDAEVSGGATASAQSSTPQTSRLRTWLKAIPGARSVAHTIYTLISLPGSLRDEWRFLRQSRERLRGMDLLLIAGSNQFLDNFGGSWGFPYAMLKWTYLGRMAGAKVAFVSIGAGPLSSWLSRLMVRLAMRVADDISFRDDASRRLVVCSWAGQNARVAPDLAFSLQIDPAGGDLPASGRRPSIGINPMPVHDRRYWHEANDSAYEAYVAQLASFCGRLESEGYPWYFFSTQPKDTNVMRDVAARMRQQGCEDCLENRMFNPATVGQLMQRIGQTEIVVATRFHGVVLTLVAGRPALGVCYHRKTADVLEAIGLGEFHVNIDQLDSNALVRMLGLLEGRRTEFEQKVRDTALQYRQELNAQYERLLDLVPDARQRGARVSGATPAVESNG